MSYIVFSSQKHSFSPITVKNGVDVERMQIHLRNDDEAPPGEYEVAEVVHK